MFRHPEIDVKCHTSGKVTKDELYHWYINHYFKEAGGENSLLVLDSYPAYKDRAKIDKDKPVEKE